METTEDRLITTEELAAKMQVHPRTVLRMLAAGEIPASIDRPSMKRFDWTEVRAALAAASRTRS